MAYLPSPDALVTLFAYMHIISAMGWLGGAVLFASSIAPSLRAMSPPASLEFLAKALPKVELYFVLVPTSTVVFGPALLMTIPDFSPTSLSELASGSQPTCWRCLQSDTSVR